MRLNLSLCCLEQTINVINKAAVDIVLCPNNHLLLFALLPALLPMSHALFGVSFSAERVISISRLCIVVP